MRQNAAVADARYKILRALLILGGGGSTPGSLDLPWVDVAAGTAITPTLTQAFLSFDATGAQSTLNLMAAPPDGWVQWFRLSGNGATPVIVNATGGKTVELLNDPGVFGASTWAPIQGQVVAYKFDGATNQWKLLSNSTTGTPGQPSYNPGWYAALTIFIDPQNSSLTASDANDGRSAGAALRTYAEAVRRWASTSPSLGLGVGANSAIAVTFLSSHTDGTDPVDFTPIRYNGVTASIQGAAPASTAAVFTRNAAKSRAAGSNARLSGSFSAGAIAPGVLLENTTHSSRAFVDTNIAAANFNVTQPFAKLAVPSTTNAPAEVDTWVSTNAVNVLALIAINVVRIGGTLGDVNGAGDNFLYLYQCAVFDPSGTPGTNAVTIQNDVQCQEVVFQRGISYAGDSTSQASGTLIATPTFVNCYYLGGLFCVTGGNYFSVIGGGTNNFTNVQGNVALDGDYIAGGFGLTIAGRVSLGLVYYDASITSLRGEAVFATQFYGSHVLYGTTGKQMNLSGRSRGTMASGTYAAGWTQATLIATGVQLNGTASGQTHTNATPDVVSSAVATTVANADAANGGDMMRWGGASISKAA
jgi:hypothetical protein